LIQCGFQQRDSYLNDKFGFTNTYGCPGWLVWAILGRYGYWPERFRLDPRPDHPSYTQAILDYRNGNKDPLENYLLSCIANLPSRSDRQSSSKNPTG
jgi:hypothetical protein